MAAKSGRVIIVDEREDSRVPFLRGILTRSLTKAGLPFDDAYELANRVRGKLARRQRITTTELKSFVAEMLVEKGHEAVAEAYRNPRAIRAQKFVRERSGTIVPFSKGVLRMSLEICALSGDDAQSIAAIVEERLPSVGNQEITSSRLARLTYETVLQHRGKEPARRFLQWIEFTRSGRPLIVLVGGTTGCGKSTLSAHLAHRLNIVRTQSTDMLREVMRQMVPMKLLPSLHRSSFNAHQVLPRWGTEDGVLVEPHMVDGYLMQAEEVGIGIDGVFRRAVKEQISLILEGVHIHPAMQKRFARREGAIVVPVMLAVLKKKRLRRQLIGRGQEAEGRRAARYLDNMDAIWQLQTFLLSEAERNGISLVVNDDQEEALRLVLHAISDRLAKEFKGDPDEVFGT